MGRMFAAVLVAQRTLVDEQLMVNLHHEDILFDGFVHLFVRRLEDEVLSVVFYTDRVRFLFGNQLFVGFPLAALYSASSCRTWSATVLSVRSRIAVRR